MRALDLESGTLYADRAYRRRYAGRRVLGGAIAGRARAVPSERLFWGAQAGPVDGRRAEEITTGEDSEQARHQSATC